MTTKYNIGQQVWCISENHLIKDTIDFIAIDSAGINYCTKKYEEQFTEDLVFDNPADATIAWMELNDLAIEIPHIKTSVVAVIKPLESN